MDELKKEFWRNLPDSEKKEFINEAISSALKELGHEVKNNVLDYFNFFFDHNTLAPKVLVADLIFKSLLDLIDQDSAFNDSCDNRGDRND